MLYEPLESMFESSGFDEQARLRFSMDVFFEREDNASPLWHLYQHWAAQPEGRHGLPQASMCDPKRGLPGKIAKWIAWIDTTREDPSQFVISENPECHIPGMGTELSGKHINDVTGGQLHMSGAASE